MLEVVKHQLILGSFATHRPLLTVLQAPLAQSYDPNMVTNHGKTYTCHDISTISMAIATQILPTNALHALVGYY